MNYFKKVLFVVLTMICCNTGQQINAQIDVVGLQKVGLMGFGGAASLAGLAAFYSLLKSSAEPKKETPFNDKDYLAARAVKSSLSLIVTASKFIGATALTAAGLLIFLGAPSFIDQVVAK